MKGDDPDLPVGVKVRRLPTNMGVLLKMKFYSFCKYKVESYERVGYSA